VAQLCLGDFELLLKQCDGGMNGGPAAVGCCSADDAPKHRSSKGSCNVDLCPFGPLINLRLTFDASWPKGELNVFAAQGPQNFTRSADRPPLTKSEGSDWGPMQQTGRCLYHQTYRRHCVFEPAGQFLHYTRSMSDRSTRTCVPRL
jgi:hypothetical protein